MQLQYRPTANKLTVSLLVVLTLSFGLIGELSTSNHGSDLNVTPKLTTVVAFNH